MTSTHSDLMNVMMRYLMVCAPPLVMCAGGGVFHALGAEGPSQPSEMAHQHPQPAQAPLTGNSAPRPLGD
jgi:hypothetical protein